MKTLLTALLGLALFSLASFARADDTAKLVGKWEVTKSTGDTPVGTQVEFAKDGKLNITISSEGKAVKIPGTYKLDGKKLSMTLKLNEQKIEQELATAFEDGDNTLKLTDAEKKVDTLKRKK